MILRLSVRHVRRLEAEHERRSFSLQTTLNMAFTPHLTLQLFARPLLSSGNYLSYNQLPEARTFDFEVFIVKELLVGTVRNSPLPTPVSQRMLTHDIFLRYAPSRKIPMGGHEVRRYQRIVRACVAHHRRGG